MPKRRRRRGRLLLPESQVNIDDQRGDEDGPDDPAGLQLSNFYAFEDRAKGAANRLRNGDNKDRVDLPDDRVPHPHRRPEADVAARLQRDR